MHLGTAKRAVVGALVALALLFGGDVAGADAGMSTTPLRPTAGIDLMGPAR